MDTPKKGKQDPFAYKPQYAEEITGKKPSKVKSPTGEVFEYKPEFADEVIKKAGGSGSGDGSAPTVSKSPLTDPTTKIPGPTQAVPPITPLPAPSEDIPANVISRDIDEQFSLASLNKVLPIPLSTTQTEVASAKTKKEVLTDPTALSTYMRQRGEELSDNIKSLESQKHRATSSDGFLSDEERVAIVEKNKKIDQDIITLRKKQDVLGLSAMDIATDQVVSKLDLATFNPDKVGRDLIAISNPHFNDQLNMVEKGGNVIPGIQKAEMEMIALTSIENYINKHPDAPNAAKGLSLVKAYRADFEERNYELTASRVREKIAAQNYRKGNSGFFGNSEKDLNEVVNDPETDLTPTEKKIARQYVIPLEKKNIGTDIPGSGFFRSAKNAIERSINTTNNTIADVTGFRSESDIAEDNLNAEVAGARFRAPGEGPRGLSQLQALRDKEKNEELTAAEKTQKVELEKYVDIRNNWSRFKDGVGDLTGQVVWMALGSKGVGAAGKALSAWSKAGGFVTGGLASGAVGTALSTNTGGLIATSFLQSYDNYKGAAIDIMPGADQAAEREGYALAMSGVEALSEMIFPDTKVLGAFMDNVRPSVIDITQKLVNREITQQVAKAEMQGALVKYMKSFAPEFAKSTLQNASEEAIVDVAGDMAATVFGGQDFNVAKTGQQALNTFFTTALYSPLVAGMAAHGAYRNQRSQNAFMKSSILNMASNPAEYLRSVEDLQTAGHITQDEANEKIQLVKTASKLVQEIPASREVTDLYGFKSQVPFDYPERSSYLIHRLNEGILTEKIKATSDPVEQKRLQKQLDRSIEIREGIYDGKIGVTSDITEVTNDAAIANDLGIAATVDMDETDLIGTGFEGQAGKSTVVTPEGELKAATVDVSQRTQQVRDTLGHEGNKKLFDDLVSIIDKFKTQFPEHAKTISDNIDKLSAHIVGGVTDAKRNSQERGDLDLVFLNEHDVDRNTDFGKAVGALQYFIIDEGNGRQQSAIEGKLRPAETSSPIDITDIIASKYKETAATEKDAHTLALEAVNDIDLTDKGAGMQGMKDNPEALLKFIQEQATGLTADRSNVNSDAYFATVKEYGQETVDKAIAALTPEEKQLVREMHDVEGRVVATELEKALAATPVTSQAQSSVSPEVMAIADKIEKGVTKSTPEELQAYENNREAVEAELKRRRDASLGKTEKKSNISTDENIQNQKDQPASSQSVQPGKTQQEADQRRTEQSAQNVKRRKEVRESLVKLRDKGLLVTADKSVINRVRRAVGMSTAPVKMTDKEIDIQMALLDAYAQTWKDVTGEDNFYEQFIEEIKEGDLTVLKNMGGALHQDSEVPDAPVARVTLDIFSLPQFQQMKGKQVNPVSITDLIKGKGKQIEKDIINEVLAYDKYKGQKRISFDEFRNDVEIQIMKLEHIPTATYAGYGMENMGDDEDIYGDAKTIILNTPINHGQVGHFPNDFHSEKIDPKTWDVKQIPGTNTWVAMDRDMPPGTPQDQIANYVGTAGSKAVVENWIEERANPQERNTINKGMFGHIRQWFNENDGVYHLAELQSDYYQNNKATDLIAEEIPQEEIDAYMNKEIRMPYNKRVAEKIKDEFGITAQFRNEEDEVFSGIFPRVLTYMEVQPPQPGLTRGEYELAKVAVNGLFSFKSLTPVTVFNPATDKNEVYYRNDDTLLGSYDTFEEAQKKVDELKEKQNDAIDLFDELRRESREFDVESKKKEQEFINKRVKEKQASATPSLAMKQFIASQKVHEVRIFREAIKIAAESGAKTFRFPTPYTLAVIEGYISGKGQSSAPYDIVSAGDSSRLVPGDKINYDDGAYYTVIWADNDEIKVAPTSDVSIFSYEQFLSEEAGNRISDAEYELDRELGKERKMTKEDLDEWNPDGYHLERIKDLMVEYLDNQESDEDAPASVSYKDIKNDFHQTVADDISNTSFHDHFDYSDESYLEGDTVYLYDGRSTETFNQPDHYDEEHDEDNYRSELSDVQETVVNKYEKLGELMIKMRSDARKIKDENGMPWLETDITAADQSNPIVAFQDEGGKVKGAVDFQNEGRATIHIFDGADISTLAHEATGHVGRRMLERLAESDEQFSKDYEAVKKWAGVSDGVWTRAAEEKFARGFEKYLREGKAPSKKLESVFSALKTFLTNIYQNITGSSIDVVLTPEVREVFDRLLGGRDGTQDSQVEEITTEDFIRLPEAVGKFEAVESIPSGNLDLTGYKTAEQIKINQPTGFGPVRLIGDEDLVALIGIGAKKYRGLTGGTLRTPVDAEEQARLEKKFGISAMAAFSKARDIATKQRMEGVENAVFIGKNPISDETRAESKKLTYTQFEKNMLAQIEGSTDSKLDFVISIPGLSTGQKLKAVSDMKKGRNTGVVKELKKALRSMYDKRLITVNTGRGTLATTVDIDIDDWASDPISAEEFDEAGQMSPEVEELINNEGVTLENIDEIQAKLGGLIYDDKDFDAAKAYLSGTGTGTAQTEKTNEGKQGQETETTQARPEAKTTGTAATESETTDSGAAQSSKPADSGAAKGKELAERIRQLKSKRDILQSNILGVPIAIYDGAVEAVSKAFELGGAMSDIIAKGVDYIRSKWPKGSGKFDPNEMAKKLRALIMGALFSAAPLTVNTNVQTYSADQRAAQEQKLRDKSNQIIDIKDNRTVDIASGKPITDKNKSSAKSTVAYIRSLARTAVEGGVDPYTMLSLGMQETRFDDETNYPLHQWYEINTNEEDPNFDPFRDGVAFLKKKMEYAKKIGKQTEAEQIQAWNGYGKIGKERQDGLNDYYGIDGQIDMNTNPVYGKRIVDIRDNILKRNPEIVKIVDEVIANADTKKRIDNIKNAGKSIADSIRGLKVPKANVLQSNIFGLPIAVYDAAIEVVALAVEGGAAITQAIAKGIDYINTTSSPDFDEAGFKQHVDDFLGGKKPKVRVQVGTKAAPESVKSAPAPEANAPTGNRRFTEQMLRDEEIDPVPMEQIAKTLNYTVQTNRVTIKEANRILTEVGPHEAYNLVTHENGMNPAVRVVLGQVLIKQFNQLAKNAPDQATKDSWHDKTIEIARFVTEEATKAGQGIQAFSLYSRLSPEAQIRRALKDAGVEGKRKREKRQDDIVAITKELNKANEEAANELTQDQEFKKKIKSKTVLSAEDKIRKAQEKREQLKKNKPKGGDALYSNGVVTPQAIEYIGNLAKTYIDEGIAKATIIVDNIIRDLQEITGKVPPAEVISEVNNIVRQQFDRRNDAKIQGAMKNMEKSINDIVRNHYKVTETDKRKLVEKFEQDLGMDPKDAGILASDIEAEFDKIATRKKKAILERDKKRFDRVQKGLSGPKPVKKDELHDKIIKYTNLGAFDDKDMGDFLMSKLGTGTLSQEQISKITELAEKVENAPEGSPKTKAIQELLAYQANMAGSSWGEVIQAVWYANVLSGYSTQLFNLVSTFFNAFMVGAIQAARDPKSIPVLWVGATRGIGQGLTDARNTWATGESPLNYDRAETPDILERKKFTGFFKPVDYLKYVGRLMKASDVIFFNGLKEMRSTQLAYREAQKEGLKNPFAPSTWKMINEKLFNTPDDFAAAQDQARDEGFTGYKAKRRANEIMEMNRPEELVEESRGFAARGTFNHDTEGTLGALTDRASTILDFQIGGIKPVRFAVPFTRVLTNVVNNALDYTPYGFVRGYSKSRGFESFGKRDKKKYIKLDEDRQYEAKAKASLGIAMTLGLYALTKLKNDDDEPLVEFTSGGTGDYAKDAQLRLSGWQPYSVKIGDTYFSYRSTPLIFMLSWLGSLNELEKYGKASDEDLIHKWSLAAWQFSKMMTDMTWIGSSSAFLGAFNSDNPDTLKKNVGNTLTNMGKSFVVPNLYSQLAQEAQSIYNTPQKETNAWYETLIQDVPIANNSLNDKVNALGDPVVRDKDIFVSGTTVDPVLKFLLDKKGWIAPVKKGSKKVWDRTKNQMRPITNDEYYEFSKMRGQMVKERLQDIMENGAWVDDEGNVTVEESKAVGSKSARDMTTAEVNRVIKSMATSATKRAEAALGHNKPTAEELSEF